MVAAYSTVTPSTTAMPDSVAAEKARWLLRAPLVLPDAEGEGTAERAALEELEMSAVRGAQVASLLTLHSHLPQHRRRPGRRSHQSC